MKTTALIAEDEAPQRTALVELLKELWPAIEIVGECENGLTALECLQSKQPDVAFLDIRMPGLSGVEIARVANTRCHIVFTTAYDEYAVQAFERGALDYILKPIRRERLASTVQRLQDRIAKHEMHDVLEAIDSLQRRLHRTPERLKWITASIGTTTKLFALEDVLYFKAEEKYTCVATATDRAHIRMSLRELLAELDPETFWQVHRSVIVRAEAIRAVKKNEDGKLILQLKGCGDELPISSAFHHRFKPM